MAVAGLVFGILAIVSAFVPCVSLFSFLPALLGIIFSAIGLSQAKRTGEGKGMAIAGLVLSILAVIWIPIFLFLILGGLAAAGGSRRSGGRSLDAPTVYHARPGGCGRVIPRVVGPESVMPVSTR